MDLRDESEDRSKVTKDVCAFNDKIILQQIAVKYKLPDRNILPYRRY